MVDNKKISRLDCNLNDLVFGISLGEGKFKQTDFNILN